MRAAIGAFAALLALAAAPADAAPSASVAAFDAVRQQCIAAAQAEQRQEAAVADLRHQIALVDADAAGRRRDIADSRPQQAHLLAALAFLARHRGAAATGVSLSPLDRQRGDMLIHAAAPELRAEARSLIGEIGEIARLRREAARRRPQLTAAEATLARERSQLAQFVARRRALVRQLPAAGGEGARLDRIAARAADLGALIRLADAAAERRATLLAASRGGDPARPAAPHAFDPPQSALRLPVSGTIARRFGAPDAAEATSQGLEVAPRVAGAEVVAPFDGQVVYAGEFHDFGLLLILRHGTLYHSVLAGLGRIGVVAGERVRTGEPIGALPDAGVSAQAGTPGSALYFEVRRNGQPVDPQPLLAMGAAASGEQRVGQ